MLPFLGTCTGWRSGQRGTLRYSTGTKAKSCHRQEAPRAAVQAGACLAAGSTAGRDLGALVDHTEHEPAACPSCRDSQQCPGRYSQAHSHDIEGRDYPLIPSTSSIPHPILSLQIQERHQQVPDLVPDFNGPSSS